MRLNQTKEKHFTYAQTAKILETEGLGHTRGNVSFHVKVSKRLKCVTHLGDPYMITRASLEAFIERVKSRGGK